VKYDEVDDILEIFDTEFDRNKNIQFLKGSYAEV